MHAPSKLPRPRQRRDVHAGGSSSLATVQVPRKCAQAPAQHTIQAHHSAFPRDRLLRYGSRPRLSLLQPAIQTPGHCRYHPPSCEPLDPSPLRPALTSRAPPRTQPTMHALEHTSPQSLFHRAAPPQPRPHRLSPRPHSQRKPLRTAPPLRSQARLAPFSAPCRGLSHSHHHTSQQCQSPLIRLLLLKCCRAPCPTCP